MLFIVIAIASREQVKSYNSFERFRVSGVQSTKFKPMKKLIILFFLFPLLSWSLPPEKILPKTLELRPLSWYNQQAQAWSEEINRDKRNAQSWFNYYAASYFSQADQSQLDQIVRFMAEAVPAEAYELLLVKGWNTGYKSEAFALLKKAYEMKPERPDAYGLLQILSELNMDSDSREAFSKQLLTHDQLSPSLLSYSYNVLMSLEPLSVLITEGESTTSPLFALQDAMNVRKDVSILNLDLLTNASYLEAKLKSLGLNLNGPVNTSNLRSTLCALLPAANSGKKFNYALTVSKDNLTSIKENLYIVGLASVHSITNFDNVDQIRKNLEKEFLLDYLRVDFNGESGYATGKVLSSNYLVPMILLYESYVKENKSEQAKELRLLMERVAQDCGKEKVIADFLDHKSGNEIPYYPFSLDIKSLDEQFRPVYDKIYANAAEVTNEQYNLFLRYLSSHSLTDLWEKYKFDFSSYEEPTLSLMKNYSSDRVPNKKQKYFTQYPAVDVSYEAATAYCDWLTQQYNNSPTHKFKKVKFRLPSIDEWQIAAAGIKNPVSWKLDEQKAEVRITPPGQPFGKEFEKRVVSLSDPEILYPWFKYFVFRNSPVNNRGCYLGNFKVPDASNCPGMKKFSATAADGFLMTGPVQSYFPNDIGLSDVVGNVAEMTLEKGKACGGSWNHTPQESTIKSINSYSKPDAAIGFRVFMEVIEK